MNIETTQQDGIVTISVDGRVDTTTAKEFEAAATKVLSEGANNIVVDCSKISYVSSSGLRIFLILQKGVMAKKGSLVLRGMLPEIKEIFKITGFATIMNIE